MKQKHWLLVTIAVLMALVLSACELRAATPPAPTATPEGGFPVPGTETLSVFQTIATQTAMAGGGVVAPTDQVPQATTAPVEDTPVVPQPVEPTAVPPTQAPVIVVPTATPGMPSTYTLQKGEFPYCIARRFNVNPYELLQLNGLGVNTVVQPGTNLRIPTTGNGFPDVRSLHSHPTTYTVKAGDTIYTIACYFGDVDPNMIVLANNLSEPYTLTAGTTINIP